MQETHKEFESDEAKNWLRTLLKEREVVVTFAKVNGDERVMTCTLQEESIPKEHRPKLKDTHPLKEMEEPKEDRTCTVYDVNAKGWRSFRWANVKKIDFSLEAQNG